MKNGFNIMNKFFSGLPNCFFFSWNSDNRRSSSAIGHPESCLLLWYTTLVMFFLQGCQTFCFFRPDNVSLSHGVRAVHVLLREHLPPGHPTPPHHSHLSGIWWHKNMLVWPYSMHKKISKGRSLKVLLYVQEVLTHFIQ